MSNFSKQLTYYKQLEKQGHYQFIYPSYDLCGSRVIMVVSFEGQRYSVFNETQDKQAELDYNEQLAHLPHHAGDWQ